MRTSTLVLVAAAGLAAASPSPQLLDFDALDAAPLVETGPVGAALNQTIAVASTVPVTAAVTPSATASFRFHRRELEKRMFWHPPAWCINIPFFHTCPPSGGSGSSGTSTSSSGITSATYTMGASATSVPVSSVPATSVPISSSGTSSTSPPAACPTTPEEGTYCGFINPEDACSPQPGGSGPVPSPDTVSAFLAYAAFHSMASAAPTTIPSTNNTQYSQVFRDLDASVSANSYIGLYTLTSYSAQECATLCDQTSLCTAFNLHIERDPSLAPANNDNTTTTVWGTYCPNPAAIANYKCTLWGSSLDATMATNQGGWREQFQVVIAGSDAWDKTNATTPTVEVPPPAATTSAAAWKPTVKPGKNCGGKAIDSPKQHMGSHFVPGPFNAQLCANYALEQNEVNRQAALQQGLKSFIPCKMFNSYFLHKNDMPFGTYCSLYGAPLDSSYATYSGGDSGSDQYQCKQSWTFEVDYEASYFQW